jgi:hypothetical protein
LNPIFKFISSLPKNFPGGYKSLGIWSPKIEIANIGYLIEDIDEKSRNNIMQNTEEYGRLKGLVIGLSDNIDKLTVSMNIEDLIIISHSKELKPFKIESKQPIIVKSLTLAWLEGSGNESLIYIFCYYY